MLNLYLSLDTEITNSIMEVKLSTEQNYNEINTINEEKNKLNHIIEKIDGKYFYKCDICEEYFSKSNKLEEHTDKIHTIDDK